MDPRPDAAQRAQASAQRSKKKVAAALAAVEILLREEAQASASRIARPSAASSQWGLAGRLALMNGRMAGGLAGRR